MLDYAQKIPTRLVTLAEIQNFMRIKKHSIPLAKDLALYNVKKTSFLATLWKALIRQSLFNPLASLDIFGQWHMFI